MKSETMLNRLAAIKKTILCLALAAVCNTPVFSQMKTLLDDDFKNNEHGWQLQRDKSFLVAMDSGVLHIEKYIKNFTDRGCLWYNKTVPGLNTLQNFSITLYARFLSGGDISDKIDLQWGNHVSNDKTGATESNLYQMNIMFRGKLHLDYFNSQWTYSVRKDVKEMMEENRFDPNGLNKYELVQQDSFIMLNINDKPYFKQLYSPVPGNSFGFQQCMKSAWEIDRIIVRQQVADTKPLLADSVAAPAEMAASIEPDENGIKVYPNPFKNNITASLRLEYDETVQFWLMTIHGAVLQQHSKKMQKGIQQMNMYADVAPGIYLLKIKVGGGKEMVTKLVKL